MQSCLKPVGTCHESISIPHMVALLHHLEEDRSVPPHPRLYFSLQQ
jgi:hypothetical protein